MHAAARAYVAELVTRLPRRTAVLELGSRNVNGTTRDLFPDSWYLGVDLRPGKGVDVVDDAATYTPPSPPDTVLCLEVLEHTTQAPMLVANAYRILAPGGLFIATMATDPRPPHSSLDGGPLKDGEFYRNVDPVQLATWLQAAGFPTERVAWSVDSQAGDLYVLAEKEPAGA